MVVLAFFSFMFLVLLMEKAINEKERKIIRYIKNIIIIYTLSISMIWAFIISAYKYIKSNDFIYWFIYILLFCIYSIIILSTFYRYIIKSTKDKYIIIENDDSVINCPKCKSIKIKVTLNPLSDKCKCFNCGKKLKIKNK